MKSALAAVAPDLVLPDDDATVLPRNNGTQKYSATGSITNKKHVLAGLLLNSLIATRFSFPTFTTLPDLPLHFAETMDRLLY